LRARQISRTHPGSSEGKGERGRILKGARRLTPDDREKKKKKKKKKNPRKDAVE
jgi:hypothetical protein